METVSGQLPPRKIALGLGLSLGLGSNFLGEVFLEPMETIFPEVNRKAFLQNVIDH